VAVNAPTINKSYPKVDASAAYATTLLEQGITYGHGFSTGDIIVENFDGVDKVADDLSKTAYVEQLPAVTDMLSEDVIDFAPPANANSITTLGGALDPTTIYKMVADDFNNIVNNTTADTYTLAADGVALLYITGTTKITLGAGLAASGANNNRRLFIISEAPIEIGGDVGDTTFIERAKGSTNQAHLQFGLIAKGDITILSTGSPLTEKFLTVEGPFVSKGAIKILRNSGARNTEPVFTVRYNPIYLKSLKNLTTGPVQVDVKWSTDE